jgi:hypothetical protein
LVHSRCIVGSCTLSPQTRLDGRGLFGAASWSFPDHSVGSPQTSPSFYFVPGGHRRPKTLNPTTTPKRVRYPWTTNFPPNWLQTWDDWGSMDSVSGPLLFVLGPPIIHSSPFFSLTISHLPKSVGHAQKREGGRGGRPGCVRGIVVRERGKYFGPKTSA